MPVRRVHRPCTGLKPHPSKEAIKCFWGPRCRRLGCEWVRFHQLSDSSALRAKNATLTGKGK
jgi:hypothetical protein